MYIFDFDPETNGLELSWRDTGGEIPRREARPVYAEELNTLGMDRRWRYDAACPAPLMWGYKQCVLLSRAQGHEDNGRHLRHSARDCSL